MRRQILTCVRREFRNSLSACLSQFVEETNIKAFGGADLYRWQWSSGLSFFVRILPNPKSFRDSFMIELGWSESDYPIQERLQIIERLDMTKDGRIRLPQLWRKQWPSAVEPWWEIGDSLSMVNSDIEKFYSDHETVLRTTRVPVVVHGAVEAIKQYALPFFTKIASERGMGHFTPSV